jgi:hypothetical protein
LTLHPLRFRHLTAEERHGRAARLDVPPHVTPAEARLELEQLSRTLAERRDGHRDRMDGEIDRMLGEMAGRS